MAIKDFTARLDLHKVLFWSRKVCTLAKFREFQLNLSILFAVLALIILVPDPLTEVRCVWSATVWIEPETRLASVLEAPLERFYLFGTVHSLLGRDHETFVGGVTARGIHQWHILKVLLQRSVHTIAKAADL